MIKILIIKNLNLSKIIKMNNKKYKKSNLKIILKNLRIIKNKIKNNL